MKNENNEITYLKLQEKCKLSKINIKRKNKFALSVLISFFFFFKSNMKHVINQFNHNVFVLSLSPLFSLSFFVFLYFCYVSRKVSSRLLPSVPPTSRNHGDGFPR
jgi:hypothetical protein